MNPDRPSQPKSSAKLQIKPTLRRPPVQVDLSEALSIHRQALTAGIMIHAEFIARQIADGWPDELEAQLALLDAYANTQRVDVADAFAASFLRRFPANVRALKHAAKYYQAAGSSERGIELLLHARELNPADPEVEYLIGAAYAALGLKSEAVAAFDQSIRLVPDYADAFYSRALVEKSGSSGETLTAIENLISAGADSPLKLGKLHLAAAWCHDNKDSDAQFSHLDQAGELFNGVFEWNADRSRLQLETITSFIDSGLVETLRGDGNAEPEPIYIAAMPRSGTTLLEQVLGSHSQCMPIGESQLFNHAIAQIGFDLERPTAYWEWGQGRGFAPIIKRLDNCYQHHSGVIKAGGKRIVDKSLDNYMTAGLILLTHPNARIIHLKRHPLDTILSMYQLYIEMGPNIPFRLEDLARHYLITLQYMAHWSRLFPDRIITVDYEELALNPRNQTHRVLEFCDLPWEDGCLEFYKRPSSVNTPSAIQVKQKIHTGAVNRWKTYASHLQPAADILGIKI